MILLSSAQDFDGPQPFILTDLSKASIWQGASNGKKSNSAGSDWAALFKHIFGYDVDEDNGDAEESIGGAGKIKVRDGEIDYVDLQKGSSGYLLLTCDDDKIVIADIEADGKTKKEVSMTGKIEIPAGSEFQKYLGAQQKSKKPQHVIEFKTPWAVLMSSTACFEKSLSKSKVSFKKLEILEEDIYQLDDNVGGQLVIFRLTKGKYDIFVEDEVEAAWGVGQRLVMKRQSK